MLLLELQIRRIRRSKDSVCEKLRAVLRDFTEGDGSLLKYIRYVEFQRRQLHPGKSKTGRTIAIHILMAAILSACGGEPSGGENGPYLDPGKWLSGAYKGRSLTLDRNGNIKETAGIVRRCRSANGLQGACEDTISYYYRPGKIVRKFQWSVNYGERTPAQIFIRYENKDKIKEILKGTSNGSLMKIEGKKLLPREKDKYGAVRIRSLLLPGPGSPVWEVEEYSHMGFHIGTVRTMWYSLSQ